MRRGGVATHLEQMATDCEQPVITDEPVVAVKRDPVA